MPGPDRDCGLCPRLVKFRTENRTTWPDWHNAPVASFGDPKAKLLIVGLAPGLKGANRTGRPFTGDYAGDLLYGTLLSQGLARGAYGADPKDGLKLLGCRITNAVRCLPPANKPVGLEISTCNRFLVEEIAGLPNLRVILALGRIAHDAVVRSFGLRQSAHPFRHGALHDLPNDLVLADSYHCSRYNTNTGRLTEAMFQAVVGQVRDRLRA
jgi:uracil-DNA glycosylase